MEGIAQTFQNGKDIPNQKRFANTELQMKSSGKVLTGKGTGIRIKFDYICPEIVWRISRETMLPAEREQPLIS